MYVMRSCPICLFLLLDYVAFHHRCKHGRAMFRVVASASADYQAAKTAGDYRSQVPSLLSADSTVGTVSDLRKMRPTYKSFFTTRINPETTHAKQNSDILSFMSRAYLGNNFRDPGSNHMKSCTPEVLGIKPGYNKDMNYICGTNNKHRKCRLQPSKTNKALEASQKVDVFLKSKENNNKPSLSAPSLCGSAVESNETLTEIYTTFSINGQNNARKTSLLFKSIDHTITTIITSGLPTADSVSTDSSTVRMIPTSASNTISTISTTAPQPSVDFVSLSEAPQNPIYSAVKKKKTVRFEYQFQNNSGNRFVIAPRLKMILKSENSTVFYPGRNEDSPFRGRDRISLKDTSFSNMRTWFSLKMVENKGTAYTDSVGDAVDSQTIQCLVEGLTHELIYSGWHRWEYDTSNGTTLNCETGGTSSSFDAIKPTNYPLWFDSEPGEVNFKEMLDLQPYMSGLYICIAVDSAHNVFVTSYEDVRVINVVTSINASIAPHDVTIYDHDTRASFIFNNCKGYFSPQLTARLCYGSGIYVFYLDDSTLKNESFTVSYLHTRTWIRAKPLFENLNLSSPMLLRCLFTLQADTCAEVRHLEMYFRHDSVKNRSQKVFTAVANETLTFCCTEFVRGVSIAANASYHDGNCSENEPSDIRGDGSNITLTVNKQMCLMCSSYLSKIKLQINIEEDLRTKIINGAYQRARGNCSDLWDMHKELSIVKNSNNCEENAGLLMKEIYRNKTKTFKPFTYRAYYTSRQFVVCQSQPVQWSNEILNREQFSTSENTVFLKIMICVFVITVWILIMLAWKRNCKRGPRPREVETGNLASPHSLTLASRSVLEKDELSSEIDYINSREHFKRSRISIGPLIGSGKFGLVYTAYIKRVANCEDASEVAVKELTRHKDKSGTKFVGINKEILVMRMIVPHLNIVRYFGFSLGLETNLLVMELVKGPNLMEYLREQRTRVPGFVLTMKFRTDLTNITSVSFNCKISDTVYVNIPDSRDSFTSENDGLAHKKCNSDHSETTSAYGGDKGLDIKHSQQIDSNRFVDNTAETSELSQDQWSVESGDGVSHTEQSTEEQNELYITSCSYPFRNIIAIEDMSKEIFSICRQVARGMAHIASLNIIHRDLAARNVTVNMCTNPLVVKICDFGMAEHLPEGETVYKGDNKGPRPFRWMSPEALNKGEFSTFSDVWSYGVLCWEVVTLGSTPYGKLPTFAAAAKVAAGHHLLRPSNCDPEIFAVLRSCWKVKPDERPSFESLKEKWADILEANSDYLELKAEGDDVWR